MNSDERIGRAACRVALAVAVTASIMVLPGCGKSNSSSSGSAGQTTAITAPKGTVSGTVEDDDGNPIAGASVYVAGQTPVTTNAGGQFSVGVTVTGATTSATQTTATVFNQPLTIQIVPPAGYLGASITVSPSAQITSSDIGATATGETNPQEVFIDGFTASAGIVEIPALTTTVRGTILDAQTGVPVPTGTVVDLDFIGYNPDQVANTTGIAVTYAAGGLISGTTDVNGNFSIAAVPDNSCLDLDAPGFALTNDGQAVPGCTAKSPATDPNGLYFSTIIETSHSVVFSRIGANPAQTGDTVNPYVTSVANVINETGSGTPAVGQLDSAVSNILTITFSKPIIYSPTAVFQPVVIVGNTPTQTAATITSVTPTGTATTTLTITLSKPLPTGTVPTAVTVDLPVEAIRAADNTNLLLAGPGDKVATLVGTVGGTNCTYPYIAIEPVSCGNVPPAVGFDSTSPYSLAGVGTVVQLLLQTQGVVTTNAPPPGLLPVTNPTNTTDVGYLTTNSLISTVDTTVASTTLNKNGGNVSTPPGFNEDVQLNSQAGNTSVPLVSPASDASYYLTKLATVLNGNTTKEVFTNIARVTVTIPVGATDVVVSDQSNGIAKDVLFFPINTGQGSPTVTPTPANGGSSPLGMPTKTGQFTYVFAPPPGATLPYSFDLAISGDGGSGIYFGTPAHPVTAGVVLPGDTIVAQSRASAGLLGGSTMLVLADTVPPTTALQLLAEEIAAGAGASTGAGGGVIANSGASKGIAILPISPQSGDKVYSTTIPYSQDSFQDDSLNVGVGDTASGITIAAANSYANSNNVETCANAPTTPTCVLADATSTTAYLFSETASLQLGIAIDEPVALTGTTAPTYTGGMNATVGTYVANLNQVGQKANGITAPVVGGLPKVNLIGFTAGSVSPTTVSTLEALQLDGQLKTAQIGLTGAIQDLALPPNPAVAGDNANVQLRDVFPPLVTRGFYDGTNLVVDFDEPVKLSGTIQFIDKVGTCNSNKISLAYVAAAPVPQISLVQGPAGPKTEVVIPALNILAQPGNTTLAITDCLGGQTTSPFSTPYPEAAYNNPPAPLPTALAASQIPAKLTHGGINYNTVPDTADNSDINLFKGNTWQEWAGENLGFQDADFLVANILGPFALANAPDLNVPTCSGNVVPTAAQLPYTFSCTITLSQPLLIAAAGGLTTDATGDTLQTPTGGVLTSQQITNFICGTGSATGTPGKVALVVPTGTAGTYKLAARCTSATLSNSTGFVYNNTGTVIGVTWTGLTATGGPVAGPGLAPAHNDVVLLAVPGNAPQDGSTVVTTSAVLTGPTLVGTPDLQSAYTLSGTQLTEGTNPSSIGIIGNTDNQFTPEPGYELTGNQTP